ncbi:MAG: N-acetylneuraminate synthase family protein, partial [Flavobacterium sp.]|nr:N-acetylneuraminate synthase family protein [Flavobacterium sp.]
YDSFVSKANPNYEPFIKAMIHKSDWEIVFKLCSTLKLDVIYMPCDELAAELAVNEWKHFIKFIDIHPINFIYQPILDIIKKSGIDIIIGVGGRTLGEIENKIDFYGNQIKVLMFGHQAFPTQLHQSSIAKIVLLKEKFTNLIIGYADHSPFDSHWGVDLQSVAYMLGARMFEKHIALVAGEERFDYITSSSPEQIRFMVSDIAKLDELNVEYADLNKLNESEIKYTSRQLKAVASQNLNSSHVITEKDLKFKMIESESGFIYSDDIVGKSLLQEVKEDQPILYISS